MIIFKDHSIYHKGYAASKVMFITKGCGSYTLTWGRAYEKEEPATYSFLSTTKPDCHLPAF